MPLITLNKLPPNSKGKIVKIGLRGKHRLKLMDMGLIGGVEVEVLGLAPLGDPMKIKLKGFNLSLRKEDAEFITVSIEEENTQL